MNLRKKFGVSQALFALPLTERIAHGLPEHEAIRWIERATVGHITKVALFMHPAACVRFAAIVPRHGRFLSTIALLPEVWEKNIDGVIFSVTAENAHGIKTHTQLHIHPKNNPAHRRWVPLSLSLRRFAGQTITLTLATSLSERGNPTHAWAVWGDPCIYHLLTFCGFIDKIKRHLMAEGPMGMLFNSLRVKSNKNDDPYLLWQKKQVLTHTQIQRIKKECVAFAYQPKISILTPVYNTNPRWLKACIDSVRNQYYRNWELCLCDDGSTHKGTVETLRSFEKIDPRIRITYSRSNQGIATASNVAASLATGEFIGLLDNDDVLAPDALYEVVCVLQQRRDTDMIYSDEDKLDTDGVRVEPFFKPDWSPEYFLSTMYTSHFGVYRKKIFDAIGGFRSKFDKAQDYDMVLRFIEQTTADCILHIPKILYHWRKAPGSTASSITAKDFSDQPATRALRAYVQRNHLDAEVIVDPQTTYHRIKYRIRGEPLVSILLPTNGRIVHHDNGSTTNLLIQCLSSIEKKTTYPRYKIILAHNGNLSPETMVYVQRRAKQSGRYTLLHYNYAEPFNFAHKLNFIASHARGEYFVILNDDIEVISPEWMTALLEHAQQPEIGVVGAKLYFPNGNIQHAGVIMGIGGGASHVFTQLPHGGGGYFSMAKVVRNYSVVTGACCMTKASLFRSLGGLDEMFRIDYNDVDYCLRVRQKGYRVVYTPYAELFHHESVSLGSRVGKTDRPEELLLRKRWATVIANDPYYNPNLTRHDTNYQVMLT